MTRPATQVMSVVQRARFDPRAVLLGMALLFVAAIGGFLLAGVMADKIDKVVTPVAQTCRANTAAAIELTTSGACAAADQARQAGPYVITKAGSDGDDGTNGRDGRNGQDGADAVSVPGRDGRDGTNGTNGQNGVNGTNGNDGTNGQDGTNGTDGITPPCLTEPMQCRGADGRDGTNGANGADGAPAPASGTYLLPDGRTVTCARAAGTDLDPIYRCQFSGGEPAVPEPTSDAPGTE